VGGITNLDARDTDSSNASPARRTPRGPAPLRVRRALPADARAIAEIGVLGWQAAYRRILPGEFLAGMSVDAREVAWRSMLESDEEGLAPSWVAELEAHPIGFVATGPPRDEDVPLPAAEVYALYVLPAAWRAGTGGALLDTAVNYWRAQSVAELVLWVLAKNRRARAFYESQGWRPDGADQPVDIGGTVATEVRYRLPR
jgi:GNAT superfamily N-acetyltransferase